MVIIIIEICIRYRRNIERRFGVFIVFFLISDMWEGFERISRNFLGS